MTSKHRIIQVGSLAGSPSANQRLADSYDVIELWKYEDRQAALARFGPGVTALVTSANMGASAELIAALPDLKAICSWGVGYETIDVEAARQRGVQVSNTPDVLTDCVADLAWGLLIAAARRMGQGERFVRAGRWGQVHGSIPLGMRVSGKKLGVVGLGRIGEAIARRGLGFDMQVRYHNRRRRDDVDYGYAASLTELAEWADFLVVATVGGPSTRHLVGREALRALGPKGIIVNIARGPVIDEAAMVALLESGELGFAALDVFEHEPKVPDFFKTTDQAVVLPHIGSATTETRMDMENLMLDNLAAYFATGKVITPV
ncbi:2-hydroxyacid dehydrogenase [Bordetella hinzii]|uniref:2-hydroxyacid dehydrogenase n=1 Tax=Bordetella hinzii TaxID=103855 RepID=A0AAN1RYM5_9BORD|nr:2-hydroxyacid dehydrogenase [Bordetella hinzii]AKQ56165.1 Glyoxylate/hydroxypyruvate reductase B [Bordetella hinzii]AKQ60696.1 Glyoxylate/hydroxypyruvate reductase B [Bordetella hinzii]AZW18275.1 2-hydroxyacid dehydrogenase [Bordetella hinzii]KCB32261.1 4-phosphoerythronate dehydrogenase [Bordetella hinzii L60]KCB34355.1 4-phosphoerythronate dehydrogenase [Bordetella hinzii CA90 BAL1384]